MAERSDKLADLEQEVALAESGNRDHDAAGNVITSPKGAKGRMQVMDGTNTDPGFGVAPAKDDSLAERARVGRDYLAAMVLRYDGDLEKGLAAYNAGPGNVDKALARAKAENNQDWMSLLPIPTETVPYVRGIMSKMGKAGMEVPAVRAPLGEEYTKTVETLWDRLQSAPAGGKEVPQATLAPITGAQVGARVEAPPVQDPMAVIKANEAIQSWKDGVSWLDMVKASYDETTIPAIGRQRDRPWNFVDESFDSSKAFAPLSSQYSDPDDVVDLLSSQNQARFDYQVADIARRRENMKTMATGGLVGTLSAGLVAGVADPMTYVTGVAGMKAAALMGKSGYAMYAAGGAFGNMGYDAVRAAAGADVSGLDFLAGGILGAGLGMAGYRLGGAAQDAQFRRYTEAQHAATEARAESLNAASLELGPTATPEQVSARADQMETDRRIRNMEIVLSKPTREKMIIPEAPVPRMEPASVAVGMDEPNLQIGAGEGLVQAAPDVLPPETGRITIRERVQRAWDFVRGEPAADPDGLDLIPSGQVREAVRGILHQAQRGVELNPVDAGRLQILTDQLSQSGVFEGIRNNLGSTALALLRSESPVAKWWAMQALENTTGAHRTSTASITKYQLEHMYMGDSKNEMEMIFQGWKAQRQGGKFTEFFTQADWKEFGDQIFRYREGVRNGIRVVGENESPLIKQASDLLTKSYDTMRRHQRYARVSGFGNLPTDSSGYQPWAISPSKWKGLSDAKKRAYTRALSEEVQVRHGWDQEFSDFFSLQYVDQVNKWTNGGVHASVVPNESAVEVLKRALEARGLNTAEVLQRLQEFTQGGRKQTKGRLDRNMLTPYDDGEGGYMSLADLMETDPMTLLQRQARRVSGEVALSNFGVTSDAEVQLIRTAMEHSKATPKELEAFDQTVAEMLARPFADQLPMFVDNVRAATSLVQLGGMGFAQLVESANAVSTFGVMASLKKVPAFGRLYREISTMAKGGKVDNPVLNGLDEFAGNIGMHNYRNTWAHQMGDPNEVVYGRDSIGTVGRMIRGGQYLQGKLSAWRRIHAVQQRMVAEMAVNKGLTYVRDGLDSAALRDMGISPELAARVKAELPNVAEFDAAGKVLRYEPQKGTDTGAIKEFNDAIFRGIGQVIQETFVGETGKWAHVGYLKFLTQFRTYSIVSLEKQFIRQYRNHGALKAAGILLAATSVSAPIYLLRTALAGSMLSGDQWEKFKEQRLSPENIAMAALGYTALGGWARDVLDMGGAFTGFDVPGSPRTPKGGFLSSVVPGLSLVEDVQQAASKLVQQGDPTSTLRVLPFGRTPFVAPIFQAIMQSE